MIVFIIGTFGVGKTTIAMQLRATYGCTLIVPMTIWRLAYFNEVVGGLRTIESQVHHFTLTARLETVEACIRQSDEAVAWRLDHLQHCTVALAAPDLATLVPTDDRTPGEIAEAIMACLPR